MKNKPKLSKEERFEIDYLYNTKKLPLREIARPLGRNVSTISREITRNKQKKINKYEAKKANHRSRVRKHYSRFQWKKIEQDGKLRQYIIARLKKDWNPDTISGRMKEDKEPFYASKTAIYEWLRSDRGQAYCRYLYSKRHYIRKNKGESIKKVLIPNKTSIDQRPLGANNRTRYGHWEGDTIVSGKKTRSKVSLSVIYERKAKYIDVRKINNLKPISHNYALKQMFNDKKALSLTQDNGIENTRHEELGLDTFFCDVYSSWQKPGVENCNKMIRRYIPKGCNINNYSDEEIKAIVYLINNKPRKSLGYKTPYEVMRKNNLFKSGVAIEG